MNKETIGYRTDSIYLRISTNLLDCNFFERRGQKTPAMSMYVKKRTFSDGISFLSTREFLCLVSGSCGCCSIMVSYN